MRVPVIEDDRRVAQLVQSRLERAGHVVEVAADGRSGFVAAMDKQYDVMIIDRVLPQVAGLDIVQRLRDAGNVTPILILSALGEIDDRVAGLQSGGDDYLVKPFASSELLARRPLIGSDDSHIEFGGLKTDIVNRRVFRDGQPLRLKPREFRMLEYLMRHASKVVTREMILEGVWGCHHNPKTNIVDVHISSLRRKVDERFPKSLIHTVRGGGLCSSNG